MCTQRMEIDDKLGSFEKQICLKIKGEVCPLKYIPASFLFANAWITHHQLIWYGFYFRVGGRFSLLTWTVESRDDLESTYIYIYIFYVSLNLVIVTNFSHVFYAFQ